MKRLSLFFLLMVLLAAAVVHLLRDPDTATPAAGSPAHIPAENGAGAAAPAKSLAGNPANPVLSNQPPHSDSQIPAWLLPASRAAATGPANLPAKAFAGNADPKITRLNALLEKFERLQMQPNVDTKAAAAAISELEQINGSSVMNGIRLDVLRENLLMTDQIETASKELQSLQHAETADTPERAALLQSKTANLAALRSRIRYDVMQAPAVRVSP